ncbi:hypothetical protein ASG65_10095 [Bacillus sp. Leaf13]|nr:hypothetical protein ASG65_10095 [Bacillus sp. Leaf13]
MNNGEGYFISKYKDDEGNLVHEIDLHHYDKDVDEAIDDNMVIGDFNGISISSIAEWYFNTNKLQGKIILGSNTKVNLPAVPSWKELTERYPEGKILKVKEDFFEVTGIDVDIVTEAFKDNTWQDTDLWTATVYVKPYGKKVVEDWINITLHLREE